MIDWKDQTGFVPGMGTEVNIVRLRKKLKKKDIKDQ